MEELKLLIQMVENLPTMAVWVLVGYLLYKITVVGSIYGVIRFVSGQLFDWLREKKVEYKDIRPMLDGICIKASTEMLMAQLHRLRGKGLSHETEYIHTLSVNWLREAIDHKIEADRIKTDKG